MRSWPGKEKRYRLPKSTRSTRSNKTHAKQKRPRSSLIAAVLFLRVMQGKLARRADLPCPLTLPTTPQDLSFLHIIPAEI
jgi:hypothetical protein